MIKIIFCLLISILLFGLLGCLPEEEPILPVPTLSVPSPAFFDTEAVSLNDVVYFRDLRVTQVPARVETLSFPMNGILINSINVRVGDFVNQGDIVVELERSSYERELEQAIKNLEIAKVNLRQLEETHQLNLYRAWISEVPVDMVSYRRQHDAYSHQIDVLNIRITHLEYELERRVLRASMDGYVTSIINFREGDVTTADRRIATIADVTETIFKVSGEDAELLDIGEEVEITVGSDVLLGVVIDPLEYNITADRTDYEAYIIVKDGHHYGLTGASSGTIHMILGVANNVLCVPTRTVHIYNDRAFVVVLEDGLPILRDIETGLMGNSFTEVISGLELGELVVR